MVNSVVILNLKSCFEEKNLRSEITDKLCNAVPEINQVSSVLVFTEP